MKKVLLTGGTGFIGRHVIDELLAKGYEVHLVVPPVETIDDPPENVRVHNCDLLDSAQVRELLQSVAPSDLLHLAWYVVAGEFWSSPQNLTWVGASLELLRSFAAQGGRRTVIAGTCAEYDLSGGHCCERTTPLTPDTLYGTCKNSLHQIAVRYAETVGMSLAWGRLFFLYGPGEDRKRFIPSIILPLLADKEATVQCPGLVRDFLHSADAASGLVQLLDSNVCGPVNIASGQHVSLGQVAERIAKIIGKEKLLEINANPSSMQSPVTITAETSRLNREVGWRPRFDLNSGLQQVIRWWGENFSPADCPQEELRHDS